MPINFKEFHPSLNAVPVPSKEAGWKRDLKTGCFTTQICCTTLVFSFIMLFETHPKISIFNTVPLKHLSLQLWEILPFPDCWWLAYACFLALTPTTFHLTSSSPFLALVHTCPTHGYCCWEQLLLQSGRRLESKLEGQGSKICKKFTGKPTWIKLSVSDRIICTVRTKPTLHKR